MPSLRYVPGRRLAVVLLLPLSLCAFGTPGALAALALDVLIGALALYEAQSLGRCVPTVQRAMDGRLLLGVENTIELRVQSRSARPLLLTLRDDAPSSFSCTVDALVVQLPPRGRLTLRYGATPAQRGLHAFGALHVRVEGGLQLGAVIATLPAEQPARVYPNLRGPRRYELAARLGALHSLGVRRVRRAGGGGELEELREYVPGDAFRDVDWKATAKRMRPITRVLGKEQSQTVVLALDAGRLMAAQLGPLRKLDHAIHAALLVAHVALRNGDSVGLVVFADQVSAFVPPRRGATQYRRILEALYAVEPASTYVDFRRLVELVRTRVPRRSLLLLFTDLIDESQALPMAEQTGHLRKKHLPLCVAMRDEVAERLALRSPVDEQQAYRRAAAADLLEERAAIKAQLRRSGVGLVEAKAADLAVATVNRYLELRARHAI